MDKRRSEKVVELTQEQDIAKLMEENKNREIWIGSYQLDELYISSGSFADVHTVVHRKSKVKMCLKVVNLQRIREGLVRENRMDEFEKTLEVLEREEDILTKCENRFIIKLFDCFSNPFCKVFFLEYCEEGTLASYI